MLAPATQILPFPLDSGHTADVGEQLPRGVVTFVFSDIEGSTALLRRLGPDYAQVLERSTELLSSVWRAHGGHVLIGAGDSTFAAFHSAAAALLACVDGQRRLAGESWPEHGRPHVRMGAHCGLAVPRGGDYVALAVHQAVRVMNAGHGDQVLVSEQCAREAGEVDGVQLVPLGRFRVRDFDGPTALFRVVAAGLRREFPSIRAVPAEGHNLVRPPTPFVGRERELAGVVSAAAPGRVLTLLGPGGVGKTRLAVEAGIVAAPGWDDGVWFVDLAPLPDVALVGPAVAAAVGAPGANGSDRWSDALQHLADQRALLVLDNCEHLIAALAPLAAELLSRCPGVCVVATSRERLRVVGEIVLPVDPLALPPADATASDAVELAAVAMFVDRARAVRPDFRVSEDNVAAVTGICRRLDGLPLALELAASHLSLLSPHRLLDGLDDRFALLRSRERDRPDRQRTMDAAVDWSVRLLSSGERAALRRLAVFAKDFSLEGATPALADGPDVADENVPELVWRLCERSLVAVDLTGNDSRYRLLETVRSYALRLLHEHGEAVTTAQRIAEWWVHRLGPWQPMDRLLAGEISDELENLRGLVPLLAEVHPELAQQIACTIGRFYYTVQTPRHAIAELSGYARSLTPSTRTRVSQLSTLAHLHVRNGDLGAARAVVAEAAEVQRTCGGPPAWDDVAVERVQGEVALRADDVVAAREVAMATLARPLTPRGQARMLNLLGLASYFAGDEAAAADAFGRELAVARELDDDHLAAIAEGNLAEHALRHGDFAAAARHQRACLELGLALGSPVQIAYSMMTAARLSAADDAELAVRLHAKAEQILADDGHQLYDDDLVPIEQMLAQAREVLRDRFESVQDSGRALSVPDATRLAGQALDRVDGHRLTVHIGNQRGST